MKKIPWLVFILAFCFYSTSLRAAPPPLIIGVDVDMGAASAMAGNSIYRGAMLAVSEINEKGGLLGQPLHLKVLDHRGNPARALNNMQTFAETPGLLAVIGGKQTPVIQAVLPLIHREKIIFLIPWAAGTHLVDNGYTPNHVFRVSVRDEDAAGFMADTLIRAGYEKPGILLERTAWGKSNERSILKALSEKNIHGAGIYWFHWGVSDLSPQLLHLQKNGADSLILVSQPREGKTLLRSMVALPENQRIPILSHWGIASGDFPALAGDLIQKTELFFLQTFSFLDPPFPDRADHLFRLYKMHFPETQKPEEIPAPAGLVHSYDLVHLLAKAVAKAKTSEREKIRDALENIDFHGGIMKNYRPPFTPSRHDALGPEDFRIACFTEKGSIIPCTMIKKP
ncbi:amino acid/amide ABC transporter substrate-binding protein, HAAT family (TC 3.A.1.4.-) [Desulfobotulus alkaliphilus]|uniref:Amino acid/amide ABC transporter substrate-binding protein, HAAT family (TC 3.A.1.4.-) n=1 Tax=Desulfobotulus alkaliphilus TaxID=622671 RepID=A0A562RJL9_9BACT|nr:ABC transporter substrate-binding protein [Desulfobotulus alkaliphilus]TWI68596.1 amino acid/amide ABC transporter substrate-binding protein, HAAT family (TC 3.A.1.4.-) [Desulfobotulus alkaliphilus]